VTCNKPDSFCSYCAKRAATVDCRGKLPDVVQLWPPEPSKESWHTDTANEGLYFVVRPHKDEPEPNIVDYFGDYHGFFIVQPTEPKLLNSCFGIRTSFVPTCNPQYLSAYRVIQIVRARWHNL
jgi:hypothetical protein